MRRLFLFCCLLLSSLAAWALQPASVAVVYNADSPLSVRAAQHYCSLRCIPTRNLLPLHDVSAADVTRQDFDLKIRMSLLLSARERGLMWPAGPQNGRYAIRAMVLMPDLPLRIREDVPPGGKAPGRVPGNAASVDSELMLLGAEFNRNGCLNNPFFRADQELDRAEPAVMSVCRIDAPSETAVFRMMNDPVKVEPRGLWGWVVVDSGGPYAEGDEWLRGVVKFAQRQNRPLFHESSKHTLAQAFPLMRQTALYFGWYTGSPDGPFREGTPGDFCFMPGAIACHLHSFSAKQIKSAGSWVGALLQRGAAVTAGNVAEPLLGTCLRYDLFCERLAAGYTVAEAALMATPVVSWQGVVLGDPLYRPFAAGARPTADNPFAYWAQLCSRCGNSVRHLQSETERLLRVPNGAHFAEMFAWLCAEKGDAARAATYFETAAQRHALAADRIRAQILAATCLVAAGKKTQGEFLLRRCAEQNATSPYNPAVQRSLQILFPPPPEKKPEVSTPTAD